VGESRNRLPPGVDSGSCKIDGRFAAARASQLFFGDTIQVPKYKNNDKI
jgi:hypothetical protein